eukprot:TRINITY_DN656_c0_g1_i3.p2 TRINITY_DN656_c0_g1~~TRINITY_DN656_c0_g1_i3.p2  ORF type:complete len:772 (-),score=117.70 TRINITY_DN656_c0_g1_i3:7009-9324(-)
MAPRRRSRATRTPLKQSSISDFFVRKRDAATQSSISHPSNAPRRSIRRPHRKSSNSVPSSVTVKQESLPRNVKRITAGVAAVQQALNLDIKFKPTAKHTVPKEENTPTSIMQSESQPQPKKVCSRVATERDGAVLHPMEIDDSPPPLTKEELLVEEALRSLECSQDVPEQQPQHQSQPPTEPKSPRDSESSSEAYQSSVEDSDEELAKLERIRATRRSSRTSNPVRRFDPSHVPETSVFGTPCARSSGNTDFCRNPDTYLAKLLRERNARNKEEGQLKQMREDIEKPTQALQDEEMFATLAKSEEEAEEKRLAAIKKYSAPVALFSNTFTITPLGAKYLVRGGSNKDSKWDSLGTIHDMVVDIFNAGEEGDRALSMLLPTLGAKMYPEVELPPPVFRMVYFYAVFDESLPNPRRTSRDELVDTLICMVENELQKFKSLQIKLPTLMNTLHKYGATMGDWSKPEQVSEDSPQQSSLESQIPTPEEPSVSDDFKRALRNLKRACKLTAAFVRLGIPLTRAIGVISDTTTKEVLCSLGLLVRILLSAFGNRLYHEVGDIMAEVLNLIPAADWPRFRLEAAKYLLSISNRLELHVELVAHLIPQNFERSRYLALDLGFISLAQWCRGPAGDPIPHPVSDYEPSEQAKGVGLKTRSYCLGDVVNLLKLLPEIDKNTDCVWAWLISYQMRLVLSEPALFHKRDPAEFYDLNNVVQRLRTCTNRLAFDVPVQHMRIELDTLMHTYRALGSNSRDTRVALLPNLRVEKKQETLGFARMT